MAQHFAALIEGVKILELNWECTSSWLYEWPIRGICLYDLLQLRGIELRSDVIYDPAQEMDWPPDERHALLMTLKQSMGPPKTGRRMTESETIVAVVTLLMRARQIRLEREPDVTQFYILNLKAIELRDPSR